MNFIDDNMKQKWKPTQYVEISIHEIFAFQDKLDAVKDNPDKVWEVVDDFFWEAENQLELSPSFLKALGELTEDDFVPLKIDNIDELFDDDDDYESNYATAQDYVNYVLYIRNKKNNQLNSNIYQKNISSESKPIKDLKNDIPFTPRHDF